MTNPDPAALLAELRSIVWPDHVLAAPELRAGHEVDWTGRWRGEALAVVRPADTGELAEVVRACARAGVAVIPQGGNTGLVGGGVPRPAGDPSVAGRAQVVVSTRRLGTLDAIEPRTRLVEVGAGVTLAELQRHAARQGLAFGLDLAARDGATVGGLIATNAGGIHVLRHGRMGDQVAGLRAVLADGRIVRWPEDDPTLDLVGSEGTLGIVVAARLRLVEAPERLAVAVVGLATVADAVRLMAWIQPQVAGLRAAELMLEPGLELVRRHLGVRGPLATAAPVAVLLEADGTDPGPVLAGAIDRAPGVLDAVLADDGPGMARLWRLREGHAEAIAAEARTLGRPVHKLDIGIAPDRLPTFLARLDGVVRGAAADARPIAFGHLAEAALHVNVLGASPDDERPDGAVLGLVLELGGAVAAEHGVGVAKVAWFARQVGPAAVADLLAQRRRYDPGSILNPGVRLRPEP